ncbi:phosphoglucosamine mutase [Desulfobaculum bizertense]|uniref:Phosphoglucosamine mutase n=1 Tax=Desulfobaculum bizertense DSM 18034 TaxID=1121442 RepID=A0A1T4VKC2_9BACT|nr:phosphoglucosamine mutase [Desulfobaculum bizertense]UIJ38068.1 phosphoglucosamine mutase [Desulfobaculum bizertense]SKA65412.1 phosphoglucosamine mutase [Desulfobaculum bizertense DSM 18034]
MAKRIFGTDGLRGQTNIFPMLPEIALRLGLAAGQYFRNGKKRHKVLIGKDTRISGYVFEAALTSGFCASGMDVLLVGPLPTPAISYLTRSMRADLGVVISASHNPFMDNGIKFFDSDGFKLPDAVEDRISDMLQDPDFQWDYPAPENVGKAVRLGDSDGRYIVAVKNSFPRELSLDGVKIVVDCANGATYSVAPRVFEELGAEVVVIGNEPDGLNINDKCGSLYPEQVARRVREEGADIGLALDGDGDRLIVVDENGRILDGDQIMALCAWEMMGRDALPEKTLVATVMSNMALEVFMKEQGGQLLRTAVGDRHVVEAMRQRGAMLGGEQSGHLIFMDHSTTGDGILAALQLLRIMVEQNKPLSELAHLLEPYPQRLINVHVERKIPFEEAPRVMDAVQEAEHELGETGRVLLRYSGTESVARVMVEGQDEAQVERLAQELADVLKAHLK